MVGKRKKTVSVIVHSVPCIVEMYHMQHDVPGGRMLRLVCTTNDCENTNCYEIHLVQACTNRPWRSIASVVVNKRSVLHDTAKNHLLELAKKIFPRDTFTPKIEPDHPIYKLFNKDLKTE